LSSIPELGTIAPNMGTKSQSEATALASMADALFTPVQQRVLAILYGRPAKRFQSAELIRQAGSGTGATHRLLTRLAACGILRVSEEGNQKYYQANPNCPIHKELIALIRKTVGLTIPIREALAPIADRIQAAFVYGSIAGGTDRADSDVDLMVVAERLDYPTLYEAVQAAERQLGRSISPNLMTAEEWHRKATRSDSFVDRVRRKRRLFILGSDRDLR
jgi:predicted nucleotidyltransferase